MRVRLAVSQVEAVAKALLASGHDPSWALTRLGIAGSLDDDSRQTLETLVFRCPACYIWTRLERISGETCIPCAIATEHLTL